MYDLDNLKHPNARNRTHLDGYIRNMKLAQLKDKTIYTKIWKLYPFFKWYEFKDTRFLTNTDIEDYIIHRRKHLSPVTVYQDILELKTLLAAGSPPRRYSNCSRTSNNAGSSPIFPKTSSSQGKTSRSS